VQLNLEKELVLVRLPFQHQTLTESEEVFPAL